MKNEQRKSEERYRQLVELANCIVFETSTDGTITFCNQFAQNFFGYKKEDLLGRSAYGTILPQIAAPERDFTGLMARIVENPNEYSGFENETITRNGVKVWVVWSTRVLFDQNGVPSGILATGIDMTARKAAEESLKESEQLIRQITETMGEIFFLRTRTEILYINPAFEVVSGRSCASLYENADLLLETVYQEDKHRVSEAQKREFEQGVAFDQEYRIVRPDGTIRWVHSRSFPLTTALGEVRSAGIIEDITERKVLEDYLRIERDIAVRLGTMVDMDASFSVLLDTCLQLDGVEAGAVYLYDVKNLELKLQQQRGFSGKFLNKIEYYGPESVQIQLIREGRTLYLNAASGFTGQNELLGNGKIKTFGFLPIRLDSDIFGMLYLASGTMHAFPKRKQLLFESIVHQLAVTVARLRIGNQLVMQAELLQETNAAMRALLRQREQERSEIEQTVMDNIRGLVMPYVEKLKNTRLSDHQNLYLELLDSHLREIMTPLLQRSKVSVVLTPTEIRVAELIRQHRTTKEIAGIIGVSTTTVNFHRKSIRRKLDLTHKKTNLKSFLGAVKKW